MIQRILVPLDGSELSDAILAQVRRLLVAKDTEVVLVRSVPKDAPAADIQAAESHLETTMRLLALDGASAKVRLVRGDPAARVLEVAEETRPDLIALSTHGRSGMARWLRGSVADRLLERSRAPLLLANPFGVAPSSFGFKRVLVPLDGSETSAAVLPLVHDVARTYESEVILLHVLELPTALALGQPLALSSTAVQEKARAEAEAELARHARSLGGVRVRAITGWGSPAATILDTAEGERADLLAMTTHGRSGPSRWLYGSVAGLVLRHARCPLLVVRSGG